MRVSRLRVSVLMVAVWTASMATSVPRAEQSGAVTQRPGNQATPPGRRATQQPSNPAAKPLSQPATQASGADLQKVVTQYCVGCHNSRATTSATASGVVLDRADLTRAADEGAMWEKVIKKLRAGAMPPAGMPRPDAATESALVSFLETTLDRKAVEHPNPGRHLPHRLNRAEYENAIRDLLALDVDGSTLLPPDDSVDGFDNNADSLGVSPSLLERYLSAAAKISALAVGDPSIGASSETYRIRGDASQTGQNEALPPGTRGGLMALHTFPLDGEYVIKVKLLEINLGSIRGLEYQHQLEVTVDGERVLLAPVGGPEDYTQSSLNATNVVNSLAERLQVRVKVKAGQRQVGAAFLQKPASQGGNRLQPFLRSTLIATDHTGLPHVENVTVSGPFNPTGATDTPSRRRVFTCVPTRPRDEPACAEKIVSTLARRAYRRPLTEDDLAGLMKFYDAGRQAGGFDRGIEMAVRAVLVSPKFIFRIEHDPAGVAPGAPYRISDLELASRLSFFLWSSIPDDELLDVASRGRLRTGDELERQVRRMIADPRAQALVSNFAGQWLHIRNLRNTTPDKNDFPDFDDNLRQAFERELSLFVGSIITEDRSVLDLMTADYTFVNERLAKHYRIANVYGPDFRRVKVTEDARKGLLGKGGILLVTSHADRTSPVVRGKWILDNLIGTPPPPAPANVPPFPEETPGVPKTVRARMEQHRASPQCAGCHRIMDPIGLALENFDAVGVWRTQEAGTAIDASGELADGSRINGAVELRESLLKRPEVLVGTMTEKLLTYALGRGVEADDMPAVRAIVNAAAQDSYRFSSIVRGIVTSVPFQMRRAENNTGTN
jgi:mono/diheme cytochrome c family protein